MLTESYNDTVVLMGRTVTLAQLDITLRCATLAVCLFSLALNIVRLIRSR
jgi:hypothetical protein